MLPSLVPGQHRTRVRPARSRSSPLEACSRAQWRMQHGRTPHAQQGVRGPAASAPGEETLYPLHGHIVTNSLHQRGVIAAGTVFVHSRKQVHRRWPPKGRGAASAGPGRRPRKRGAHAAAAHQRRVPGRQTGAPAAQPLGQGARYSSAQTGGVCGASDHSVLGRESGAARVAGGREWQFTSSWRPSWAWPRGRPL
jgi:hypothetical protein